VFSAIGLRDTTHRFNIYIKDVHYFASPALVNLLSIASRYNVRLTFCHHYLAEVPRDIQEAFIGNTGDKTIFRLGMTDAEVFEKTMEWNNTRDKLFELPNFTARLVRGETIIQETLPALSGKPDVDRVKNLVRLSRQRYAVHKSQIEGKLDDFIGGQ
jgi:hypothetical protein